MVAILSRDGQATAAAIAVVLFAMTWRMLLIGLRVEEDGVKVVGFALSRRFAWADIGRFEVLPMGRYPFTPS